MTLYSFPEIFYKVFRRYIWKVPTNKKVLYLTFDDGPIPEVTPWVLDLLKEFNAKATFFCVGQNAEKNPAILQRILDEGHQIGNHTYNHLNAWKTTNREYFRNIQNCNKVVKSKLFRPPYGKIRMIQGWQIMRKYNIVMWDVLSGDYDVNLSADDCLKNVLNHSEPGSIVVFHDSLKAFKNLETLLPKVLNYYASLGYEFQTINIKNLVYNESLKNQLKLDTSAL